MVPTMNGSLNARGMKSDLLVSMNSTFWIPQLLIASGKSCNSPNTRFHKNRS